MCYSTSLSSPDCTPPSTPATSACSWATCHIRKLLSIDSNPPISEVIRCGVIPRFIHFLQLKDGPALQFAASWALANVTSKHIFKLTTSFNLKFKVMTRSAR
jgi:hypothetical protein